MRMHKAKTFMAIVVLVVVFFGCGGGLVAPVGGELTDKDVALDKYYQALKWNNNTVANLMSTIKLLPAEEQKAWIQKIDPVKQGVDRALAGWKLAIDSDDYNGMNANRAEFKRLKNEMVDLVVDLALLIG